EKMQGGNSKSPETPVRKTSTPPGGRTTLDLFSWVEDSPPSSAKSELGSPLSRNRQPAGGISSISFTEEITPEQSDALLKRRPCSTLKWREMTGSGIFSSENPNDGSNSVNDTSTPDQAALKPYQQAAGIISQISFCSDESVSPKKPASLTEVAKQKELSGNMETAPDIHVRRQISEAKSKELTGHDIFGPPSEVPPRSLNRSRERKEEPKESNEPAHRNVRTSVKVSNPAGGHSKIVFGQETPAKTIKKVHDQKVAELTGNNIFNGDPPPNSAEKPLSRAKLREMSGSDIFADGKAENRDCLGGVRKPPGGESSISLI
ncbi:hypothetical protein KI387_031092, partial [Taxus chinensis]